MGRVGRADTTWDLLGKLSRSGGTGVGNLNEKEQLNKECREEHLGGGNSQHGGSESTLFGI